jgi:Tfp pilus assembly ATPase PilU
MVEAGASDLHVKVGLPPVLWVDGILRHTPYEPLTGADTEAIAAELLPDSKLIEFARPSRRSPRSTRSTPPRPSTGSSTWSRPRRRH